VPAPILHEGIASGIVKSVENDSITLAIPETDYRIKLAVDEAAASELRGRKGKRVSGVIEASALRMHPASGGGRFIEPIAGAPRIVAGIVQQIDERNRRVLLHVGVPLWLTTRQGQDFSVIREGGLLNCYVESGTRFEPVRD
jgi:hypothetical protein